RSPAVQSLAIQALAFGELAHRLSRLLEPVQNQPRILNRPTPLQQQLRGLQTTTGQSRHRATSRALSCHPARRATSRSSWTGYPVADARSRVAGASLPADYRRRRKGRGSVAPAEELVPRPLPARVTLRNLCGREDLNFH